MDGLGNFQFQGVLPIWIIVEPIMLASGGVKEVRGYGAESRRKVVSSRLGFAIRLWENFVCQPYPSLH